MSLVRWKRQLIGFVVSALQRESCCSYRLVLPILSQMVRYDFQFHRPMFLLSNCVNPPYFPNNSERKSSSPRLSILIASLQCRSDLYKKKSLLHQFNKNMARSWALISHPDHQKIIVYATHAISHYWHEEPLRESVKSHSNIHVSQSSLRDHLRSVAI